MLLTDMLRIVRSLHMRREWFAGAAPIQCFCVICRGADVDRLHSDESDRRIGHNHNVVNLDSLHSSYVGLSASAPLRAAHCGPTRFRVLWTPTRSWSRTSAAASPWTPFSRRSGRRRPSGHGGRG